MGNNGNCGTVRRPVGRALAGVRPRALGLLAGYGAHLRLVGRARRQVRQVGGRCRRGQQAYLGGRVVGVFGIIEFVQRPGVFRSAPGHLDAVLHLVAGDGQAVGLGGGPGHVQGRGRRLAERRARHGWRSGHGGLHVGHVDREVDSGLFGRAREGVVYPAAVGVDQISCAVFAFIVQDGFGPDQAPRLDAELAQEVGVAVQCMAG